MAENIELENADLGTGAEGADAGAQDDAGKAADDAGAGWYTGQGSCRKCR